MRKGIMVIEERGDRRYGRIVAGGADGLGVPGGHALRECQQQPPCVPPSKGGGLVGGAEERKARFCAEEDVEIITAVNQMRKEQRRRDAVEAQKRREAMRKNKRRTAICLAIDIFACISCMFVFTMMLLTQDKLIALGMLAMVAVYALFTMRSEGK